MIDNQWTIRNFQPGDFEDFLRLHQESEKLDRTGRRVSEPLLKEALLYPGFQPENDLFLMQGSAHLIGIARLTGTPGVAAVTAGPGLTNTVTALKNAQLAHSPLVLIGGAAPAAADWKPDHRRPCGPPQ